MDGGVVIVGAGVIGASVAHHLGTLGVRATLVERRGVAAAASGRAGGFLARDWCDSSPLRALARPSFDMHARLANELPAEVGFRVLDAFATEVTAVVPADAAPARSVWLDGPGVRIHGERKISRNGATAQVHPARLTRALVESAHSAVGTDVVQDAVVGVVRDGAVVTGVETATRGVVPCDALVIAMGPWTVMACEWFDGLAPIMAHKATSIVLDAVVPAQALFCEYVDMDGSAREPEVYPRADEVYVCGSAKQDPLPDDPLDVVARPEDAEVIERFIRNASCMLASAPVVARQSCYLPLSPDGVPLIGKIPGTENAYVAAGHGCWGILNSPATGLAVAELIVQGKSSSVDLTAFDPARFGSRHRKRRKSKTSA